MNDLTEDELRVALIKADLFLKTQRMRWETPKAVAIVLLAAAIAAAVLFNVWLWPAHPQMITVRSDQPLVVKVVPP